MALHVCQHCLLESKEIVDHSCSGQHPGHSNSCGQRRMGAIACPSLNTPQTSQSKKIEEPPSEDVHIGFYHTPSFDCDCNHCAMFFYTLQQELNRHGFQFNIDCLWNNHHYPAERNDDWDEDKIDDLCFECGFSPITKGYLCDMCFAYTEYEFQQAEEEEYQDMEYSPNTNEYW